ncbi:MAG: serine/threonine protein kinase [Gemmatimonadales bacterium]|nr:serine/threonine protein kinase [Gemmatimonadales bacterium]
MPNRERLRAWSLALLPLVVVLLVGGWAYRTIDGMLRDRAVDRLTAALDAVEAGLQALAEGHRTLVRRVASEPEVHALLRQVASRHELRPEELRRLPELPILDDRIVSVIGSHGIENYAFIDTTGRILASSDHGLIGRTSTVYGPDHRQRLRAGQAIMLPPFVVEDVDTAGATLGPPHSATLVATGVFSEQGALLGWLDMRIDADADYVRVIGSPRTGTTGEVILFDGGGRLLSPSRFESELRQTGLLPRSTSVVPIGLLRLADPGGDLLAGFRTDQPPEAWPLTRAVAAATAGGSGHDVRGYRSYLGRDVIGAWRWYPVAAIGLAAEMTREEAYAPAAIVRRAVLALLGLLALGAALIGLGFNLLKRARARAEKAERLGQYTLERLIGEGAMGNVYRARHALLRRPTAIKLLRRERMTERGRGRFEREAQVTSQLAHPNTVAVYDYGHTDEGNLYYAMEYLRGLTLDEVVKRSGPLGDRRLVHVLKQVAGSLAEAHAMGLVHRDIKPQNIMLCHRGGVPDLVKVFDFGLAKGSSDERNVALTGEGAAVGTPLYMAPEAATSSEIVDARADLYSLGVVAYFLATGQPPFMAGTAKEVFRKHADERPVTPSEKSGRGIAPELEQVILRCLAKDRDMRPDSARALLAMLEDVVEPALGAWTTEEADAWWREHAPDRIGIQAALAEPVAGHLAVDLASRAGGR